MSALRTRVPYAVAILSFVVFCGFIFIILVMGLFAGLSGMDEETAYELGENIGFVFVLLIAYVVYPAMRVAYDALFIGRFAATPGKMMAGLKVVDANASRVTYARAWGRAFAEILTGLTFSIGYIIAAFDGQKRALHDYVCDTRVIFKQRHTFAQNLTSPPSESQIDSL